MRIFVTGGSGFVGGHLIEALVRAGHEVHAMARSERSAAVVQSWGALPVRADLLSVRSQDMRGAEAVIHAAAKVEPAGRRQDFVQANVVGTQRMLAAAKGAGVHRFVMVSTEAVLFDGNDLHMVDETHPYPARHRYLYPETKAQAERLCRTAHAAGFDTVILRPRLVWGPRDTTILPQLLAAAEAGTFMWIGGGRQMTSTTHVTNLVHAILLALDKGAGETFFIADDGQRQMREFMEALVATRGITLPNRSVPAAVARAFGALVEGAWHLGGRKGQPSVARLSAALLGSEVTVNTDKAKRVLGYDPPMSVEDGLKQLDSH